MVGFVVFAAAFNAFFAVNRVALGGNLRLDVARTGLGCDNSSWKGAYTGQEKQALMLVSLLRKAMPIKQAVYRIDSTAFFIVCDACEVLGEGFEKSKE